jgi:hypothetical protein
MRVTPMLSMLLLAGTFCVSTASAATPSVAPKPSCDCQQACRRQFTAYYSDAVRTQHAAELVCRQDAATTRMDCEVTYSKARLTCTGCDPEYADCSKTIGEERKQCRAGLRSEKQRCLEQARTEGKQASKQCEAERDQCLNACP